MITNPTTTLEWVKCEQLTVSALVEQIRVRYETLDPVRRFMFVEWLEAHSSQVRNAASTFEGLAAWLEGMSYENLRWEFCLILDEIDWWSRLDEHTLTGMLLADLTRNDA